MLCANAHGPCFDSSARGSDLHALWWHGAKQCADSQQDDGVRVEWHLRDDVGGNNGYALAS